MRISESSAYNKATVIHTRGVFRKYTLTGRVKSAAEESPLTAVSVSRKRKVYFSRLYVLFIVFGLVAE